jgi:serine/threonine protein kinase
VSQVRCLGRGGFGKAMLMRSTSCDLEMVTKKLPLATCTDDELRTLENEVRMCARLRHINIVHYLATFVRDETLLICLEHAAGGTLAACLDFRHLKNWPLPACVAARWIKQIASAVSYMHSMHVLHRDLSANNVLLTVPPSEADDANHGSVKVRGEQHFCTHVCAHQQRRLRLPPLNPITSHRTTRDHHATHCIAHGKCVACA